jgi:hypothetical protein
VLGALAAITIVIGTGEGVTIALGRDGSLYALATIGGFMLLTLWLLATGVGVLRDVEPEPAPLSGPSRTLEAAR